MDPIASAVICPVITKIVGDVVDDPPYLCECCGGLGYPRDFMIDGTGLLSQMVHCLRCDNVFPVKFGVRDSGKVLRRLELPTHQKHIKKLADLHGEGFMDYIDTILPNFGIKTPKKLSDDAVEKIKNEARKAQNVAEEIDKKIKGGRIRKPGKNNVSFSNPVAVPVPEAPKKNLIEEIAPELYDSFQNGGVGVINPQVLAEEVQKLEDKLKEISMFLRSPDLTDSARGEKQQQLQDIIRFLTRLGKQEDLDQYLGGSLGKFIKKIPGLIENIGSLYSLKGGALDINEFLKKMPKNTQRNHHFYKGFFPSGTVDYTTKRGTFNE